MRKGTYRKQPNISIDTLFDFFKTLNQNPTNDGDGETVLPEIDENLVNNLNIEINGHITSDLDVLLRFYYDFMIPVSRPAASYYPFIFLSSQLK
jgi:hypothetical protein